MTTKTITIEKKTGILIKGSTGCTCCRDENFITGFYSDIEEARGIALSKYERKAVASQYAKNGVYTIMEVEYELLHDVNDPDNDRIILQGRVFDGEFLYISAYEGANEIDGKVLDAIK